MTFQFKITAQLILPAYILGWQAPGHNLSTHFPALLFNKMNYFNFAKQASCWSLSCHSAALFHYPYKIKYFAFLITPWGTHISSSLSGSNLRAMEIFALNFWAALVCSGLSMLFQLVVFCLPGCLFLSNAGHLQVTFSLSWTMYLPLWFFSGQLRFLLLAINAMTKFLYLR